MVETFSLQSSNLSGGSYDPETRELRIFFASGRTYSYSGVDAATVEDLKAAASPGGFFARHIRGTHQYRME